MGTHSLCLQKVKPRPPGLRGEENSLFFLKRGVGGKLVSPYSPKANIFKSIRKELLWFRRKKIGIVQYKEKLDFLKKKMTT